MSETNIEEILTAPQFTVTAQLPYEENGERKTREVKVTYRGFTEEIDETLQPKEDGKAPTVAEQLFAVVTKIEGVKSEISVKLFKGMDRRHQRAIMKAITDDVFPNEEASES